MAVGAVETMLAPLHPYDTSSLCDSSLDLERATPPDRWRCLPFWDYASHQAVDL